MTLGELGSLGLPLDVTPENCLYAESALGWLRAHTSLIFDPADVESVRALPAGARLFIVKYAEAMGREGGVTSESIAGMSQSFDTASRDGLLMRYARDLLGEWLASQVRFRPAKRRW